MLNVHQEFDASRASPASCFILKKEHEEKEEWALILIIKESKWFIERTKTSYKDVALKFSVDQRRLSKFMGFRFQKLGHPTFLQDEKNSNLHSYLSALDTSHMQQTSLEASYFIQQLSGRSSKPTAERLINLITLDEPLHYLEEPLASREWL